MIKFAQSVEGKEVIPRTDYLAMLELKGYIIRRLRSSNQAESNMIPGDYEDLAIHVGIFRQSLEISGVRSTSTWRFANISIGILIKTRRLDEATDILELLLRALIEAQICIRGNMLSSFHATWSLALLLIRDLIAASNREQRFESARLETLLLDATISAGKTE